MVGFAIINCCWYLLNQNFFCFLSLIFNNKQLFNFSKKGKRSKIVNKKKVLILKKSTSKNFIL